MNKAVRLSSALPPHNSSHATPRREAMLGKMLVHAALAGVLIAVAAGLFQGMTS